MRRTPIAWIPLVLALAGVGISIVLLREHMDVAEGGLARGLFCGGAGRFDCSQVAAHESSWLLGMPLASWGLAFYIGMVGLALASWVLATRDRLTASSVAVVAALAAVLYDGYLAWVMLTQIGAVCLNCVATYAINLLLLAAFWLRERSLMRAREAGEEAPSPPWVKPAIAAVVALGIGAAAYFTWEPVDLTRRFALAEAEEFLAKTRGAPEIDMARFAGNPSRGPEGAPVQIAVFGDFQCQFCRALASHVERLQERLPESIRVFYVNAPINSKCHPLIKEEIHEDACWLAEAGECAAAAGRFWEYHDYLYQTVPHPRVTRVTVEARLAEIGLDPAGIRACLESGEGRAAVARDAEILRDLELGTVPALVLNGYTERGGTYPSALHAIVRALLQAHQNR